MFIEMIAWNCHSVVSQFPSKHSSCWRRTEDVFIVTFFCLPRRLEDIIPRRLANASWRRVEDVLKTSWRYFRKTKSVTLKTSQNVLKTSWKTRNVRWVLLRPIRKLLVAINQSSYLICFCYNVFKRATETNMYKIKSCRVHSQILTSFIFLESISKILRFL